VDTSSRYDPSPLVQAREKLNELANHSRLLREIKLYCQPFVSQGELEECVLGEKTRTVYIQEQRMNTLALPRLQLRAIACVPMDGQTCVLECRRLLAELSTDH